MDTYLWVEKYRPATVDDCILPTDLKQTFQEFVDQGHIPNLILSGSAGTGKTTVAKAMVEQVGSTKWPDRRAKSSGALPPVTISPPPSRTISTYFITRS